MNESMVARPSAQRASPKARLKTEYDGQPLERYRSRAERAYASFVHRSDSSVEL